MRRAVLWAVVPRQSTRQAQRSRVSGRCARKVCDSHSHDQDRRLRPHTLACLSPPAS